LLAGDLDFKPVVDEVVRTGMDITLMCESMSASSELIRSADFAEYLDVFSIYHSMTSQNYRAKEPFPKRMYYNDWPWTETLRKNIGSIKDGIQVRHYSTGDKHAICLKEEDYPGRVLSIEHELYELVERVFAQFYSKVTWDS